MTIYRRKQRNQRGVVLLVVVSMLVLFVLIGVTYAIVASQYRRGARIASRQKQLGVDPQQHLDSALYQLLRDTRSSSSALRGHSLLRDIYGTSVRGKINDAAGGAANPVILQNKQFLRFQGVAIPQAGATPWNGRWNSAPQYYTGCVLTFTSGPLKGTSTRVVGYQAQGANVTFDVVLPQINRLPTRGTEFVVNGHPFSGAGAGHRGGQATLGNQALRPNLFGDFGRANGYMRGGANESYDAVDHQNMALAAVIPQEGKVIPSFHRPALVRYWLGQGSWNRALQRQTILRPMNRVYRSDPPQAGDHPNFTGSNPGFDPLNSATWDIDNDNDGIPDSIWTDLGMPVQTDASGRKYKPLFALLCVDMDGKLNLNAHGNYSHVLAGQQAPPREVMLAGGTPSRQLAPSQGFGPGEISFRGICANRADYDFLLKNRYGRDGVPGRPGLDPLAELKLFAYLFTPQDLHGEVAFGIDHYGQPVFETPTRNVGGKITPASLRQIVTNTPYELNLSQPHQRGWSTIPTVGDTPYSVAELERVLRSHDADQGALPGRLRRIRHSHHLVTTDSYDMPVANSSDQNLALLRSLIQSRGIKLPPELQLGLRWDINQPFGNGRDDNNNRIIDEPQEAAVETWANTKIPFDHDNDGLTGKNDPAAGYQARQQYAMRLYSLMMAIKDPAVQWDTNRDGQATPAETSQRLAQWAVNVVDFRDSDSIMTRFRYDPNPLNGWNVDGASPIVWGCERPELLITETVAFHDRRTQDLDAGGGQYHADPNDPDEHDDNDFDQRLRPRGSLFIELYNPWTGSSTQPSELYGNTNGIVLNGHPGGSPTWRMLIVRGNLKGTDPDSWRLANASNNVERSIYFTKPGAVALPGDADGQPYRPNGNNQTIAPLQPGRYAVVGSSGQYIPKTDSYITTIGRRTDATEDDASTLLYDTTRHIRMNPNANGNQFQVRNNKGAATSPLASQAQPVVAIPVNHPRSLSISEPTGGYLAGDWDPALAAGEGAYATPLDEPLDDDILRDDNVHINYRVIYLQRLANPLLPWHTTGNPYRTIDSMSVDLSTFNGVTGAKNPERAANPRYKFFTHERGRAQANNRNNHPRNLWKHETYAWNVGLRASEADNAATHYFSYHLPNSLGWLNEPYQPAFNARTVPPAPFGKPASFYLGAPDTTAGRPAFSRLTWNNRSFLNPQEMMLVPFSNQFHLTFDFNLTNAPQPLYQAGNRGNFGHLL
ncbi:MAG: hypothetical protein VB857_08125, partial [Pirellulaceae bacterium]